MNKSGQSEILISGPTILVVALLENVADRQHFTSFGFFLHQPNVEIRLPKKNLTLTLTPDL